LYYTTKVDLAQKPKWWNWQTRTTQNRVGEIP
jgi:hypothetical protein